MCDLKKKLIKKLMSIRYFYCSAFDCYDIKEDNTIFCIDHTIYNCYRLKTGADEIPRDIVKNMVLRSVNGNNPDISKTDLFLINYDYDVANELTLR
jgi:hypothetical protein